MNQTFILGDVLFVTLKHALLLTSAWLGIGFGLARTETVARACTCVQDASWYLELESIDDISEPGVTGDLETEQAYWTAGASFSVKSILLEDGHYIGLWKVP